MLYYVGVLYSMDDYHYMVLCSRFGRGPHVLVPSRAYMLIRDVFFAIREPPGLVSHMAPGGDRLPLNPCSALLDML